jgi:hypothetical protein
MAQAAPLTMLWRRRAASPARLGNPDPVVYSAAPAGGRFHDAQKPHERSIGVLDLAVRAPECIDPVFDEGLIDDPCGSSLGLCFKSAVQVGRYRTNE